MLQEASFCFFWDEMAYWSNREVDTLKFSLNRYLNACSVELQKLENFPLVASIKFS